jgi:TonB-linked SusC/RagA family outer membrane protein
MSFRRWIFTPLLAVAAFAATATGVASQQTGTVTGRIIDAATQQPLPGAQIVVVGTTLGTLTNQEGRFLIPNVPSGARQIRAVLLGYGQVVESVNVPAGGTAVVDFELATSAIELEGLIVSSVTGEAQRARELGTNVGKIDLEEIEATAVSSVYDVLGGRTEGVVMQQAAGTAGTGARIRIRGANSVSLSNEPLIFVDGVAITTSGRGLGVGGQDQNRLNDINPGDIESIDVIKGPAATGIYGTQAANGVILITTKKGRAGEARWNAYAELGSIEDITDWRPRYGSFESINGNLDAPVEIDGSLNSSEWSRCYNYNAADANCTQDKTISFEGMTDGRLAFLSTGQKQRYGLNVSGGSDRVQYYLSGQFDDELGVYDWNRLTQWNLRANLNARVTDNVDVAVTAGYVYSDLTLSGNDNNIFSPIINGILGDPWYIAPEEDAGYEGENRDNYGFGFNKVDLRRYSVSKATNRFTTGTTLGWGITDWLRFNSNLGLDFASFHDFQTINRDELPIAFEWALGYRESWRTSDYTYTANNSLIAQYGISDSFNLLGATTVGTSYNRDYVRGTYGYGFDLIKGSNSLGNTAQGAEVDEDFFEVKTIGAFAQQELAWRDLMFLNMSIRGDDNSAFGQDFGLIWYPNVSLSWVLSEEGFFPEADFFSTLRLRGAWGQSGLRPSFRDALTYYSATAVTKNGSDDSGITLNNWGNPNLKPEITTEYELGFDMAFFQERVGLEFTYFNKQSKDALVSVPLAPSLGITTSQFENIGEISNKGFELAANWNVFDTENVGWDLRFTWTDLENKIESLDVEPITFGFGGVQRHQEGLPAGAFYAPPVSYDDANGDGYIGVDEVEVGDAQLIGPSLPTRLNSFSTTLRLWDWFSASTLLEARGGNYQMDYTEDFRCRRSAYCPSRMNPGAPLREQAAFVGRVFYGSRGGNLYKADFIRWRELSFTLSTPSRWASSQGWAQGLSVTLAARNLALFTDYPGLDPEVISSGSNANFTQDEFNTQPPVRYFLVRLNYAF